MCNLGDVEDCVANKVYSYLLSNIGGVDDCAGVMVSVGSLSTKICETSG
ncbi:MAG: hypothetical protein ACQETL_15025 [Bacteroidota bacterium]